MLLFLIFLKVFTTLEAMHVAKRPSRPPSDIFIFDLKIECHQNKKPDYYYDVQFLEYDYATNDDKVHDIHSETAEIGTIKRRIAAQMDGDEWFSGNYKFFGIFNHECTNSGERVSLEMEFTQPCKTGGICHFMYDIDLTDRSGYLEVDDALLQ